VDALPMLWMRWRCCGCVADAVDALPMLWVRCRSCGCVADALDSFVYSLVVPVSMRQSLC
jgi:hypothetical protein